MSLTRHTTTVPLKSMAMRELRDRIVEELVAHELAATTESMTDDDCVLLITKNSMIKTVASLQRHRHRPMEIEVNVDHADVKHTKNVLRTTKPATKQLDKISFRWLWILPLFGGLIVFLITAFEPFFASLFGGESLSQTQLIITVIVLSTVLATTWIYGIPQIFEQMERRRREMDEDVIEYIRAKISRLNDELITSDVVRCWSCFEALSPTDTVCSNCGNKQR